MTEYTDPLRIDREIKQWQKELEHKDFDIVAVLRNKDRLQDEIEKVNGAVFDYAYEHGRTAFRRGPATDPEIRDMHWNARANLQKLWGEARDYAERECSLRMERAYAMSQLRFWQGESLGLYELTHEKKSMCDPLNDPSSEVPQ